jgi:predicted transcriptional regulator
MNTIPLFKRSMLLSVRPEYASRILSGEKTVELRRRFPMSEAIGATAFIYSSSPVRAVLCKATISDVKNLALTTLWRRHGATACISRKDFHDYFSGLDRGYAVLLKDVVALDSAVTAAELERLIDFVPPQSFRYLDEQFNSLLSDGGIQAPDRYQRRNRA